METTGTWLTRLCTAGSTCATVEVTGATTLSTADVTGATAFCTAEVTGAAASWMAEVIPEAPVGGVPEEVTLCLPVELEPEDFVGFEYTIGLTAVSEPEPEVPDERVVEVVALTGFVNQSTAEASVPC
jgi:hypothetical protein